MEATKLPGQQMRPQDHQNLVVAQESLHYQKVLKETKEQMLANVRNENNFDATIHLSFDFVQQVHFPLDPQQPGPIILTAPQKSVHLELTASRSDSKSTALLMRPIHMGKELTQLSHFSTII